MCTKNAVLLCLFALFVVWAIMASIDLFGQRKLFLAEGSRELSDFWMPKMCLEQGYLGHPEQWEGWKNVRTGLPIEIDKGDIAFGGWYTNGEKIVYVTGRKDKVYPRIALLPLALFPATRVGGYVWTFLAGTVFLGALCLVSKSWKPLLMAMSMPFLFNIERGNPIWLSAACIAVFLAWWDDKSEWKRFVAAGCLAVAGAFKIAPLLLGAFYFKNWRWRPIVFGCVLFVLLFFVPWCFDQDGFSALVAMVNNAAEHSVFVLRSSDFGLVELWRTARIVLGLPIDEPWAGMIVVARLSQIVGLVFLVLGIKRTDMLLAVGGMILAAGNMYYYAALYMLPVFVLEHLSRMESGTNENKGVYLLEIILWLAILCPLQLVLLGHSTNQVICNVATLMLMLSRLCSCRVGGGRIDSYVLR